jgi:hypothetical protein
LIVSRGARALEHRADGDWLNPDEMPLADALDKAVPEGGEVAVVGGQQVFELVGAAGFAAFHLARARRVRLPGGRGLFEACEHGVPAASILAAGGLVADEGQVLDPDAEVTLTVWTRVSANR